MLKLLKSCMFILKTYESVFPPEYIETYFVYIFYLSFYRVYCVPIPLTLFLYLMYLMYHMQCDLSEYMNFEYLFVNTY